MDLWRESALSLAQLIRSGDVTSREVVESHLARIDAVNTEVNAVVEVRPEEVLAEAERADAALRAGESLGALHGVPFTTKTNIDVAGYATTQGSFALGELMASVDAPLVEKMRAAGAVMLARTNMPDLGLRLNTESSLYGPTHNPWRHGYTAGGSSGGEAAALASGLSPIGFGNDIGGSLRNPAFCCGVASVKPSRGRIAAQDSSALYERGLSEQVMLVDGVLARHVGDVRRGLEIVMGAHRADPQSVDVPLHGPPASKRVALVPEPAGGETDPEIADSVRRAGQALEEAGYAVEEVDPPRVLDTYLAWTELMTTSLGEMPVPLDMVLGPDALRFLELSTEDFAAVPADPALHRTRFGIARAWREFFMTYPLIVGPTWTLPAFPLGFDIQDKESAMRVLETVRFVLPANLLGLPVACVPVGFAKGLPSGVQVIGDLFREDLCLNAAEAIEQSLGVLTPIDPR
ncbi:MAG TPA: amidase [Acidimicrobiales bacterium]|nr:amidase [Acidimicrobiales bacterium]